ncbi:hypothetical protein Lal_00031452 [Lupinus albus]|nr:hypothetical protein Lal_00031452 [Lupinus albus]
MKGKEGSPIDSVIGDISSGPKAIEEAIEDKNWSQEELDQFERNKVWDLVARPNDQPITGTCRNPIFSWKIGSTT